MLALMDDWHDWVRLLVFLANMVSLLLLLSRFFRNHSDWSAKTKDLWFALTMWSLAGAIICIEGIHYDSGLDSRLVFLTAATLVTGKGVHAKGEWGGNDSKK